MVASSTMNEGFIDRAGYPTGRGHFESFDDFGTLGTATVPADPAPSVPVAPGDSRLRCVSCSLPFRDMSLEQRLSELGLVLPETATPGARYAAVVVHDGLAWVSGQLPREGARVVAKGKPGRDID